MAMPDDARFSEQLQRELQHFGAAHDRSMVSEREEAEGEALRNTRDVYEPPELENTLSNSAPPRLRLPKCTVTSSTLQDCVERCF